MPAACGAQRSGGGDGEGGRRREVRTPGRRRRAACILVRISASGYVATCRREGACVCGGGLRLTEPQRSKRRRPLHLRNGARAGAAAEKGERAGRAARGGAETLFERRVERLWGSRRWSVGGRWRRLPCVAARTVGGRLGSGGSGQWMWRLTKSRAQKGTMPASEAVRPLLSAPSPSCRTVTRIQSPTPACAAGTREARVESCAFN